MEDKIYDILGEEISPGCLISYASGNSLEIALVYRVYPKQKRIQFLKKSRNSKYEKEFVLYKNKYRKKGSGYTRRKFVGYTPWRARITWMKMDSGQVQDRVVVIKNPIFHINNPNIAKQFEIVDMAKDQGLLPREYALGEAIEIDIE